MNNLGLWMKCIVQGCGGYEKIKAVDEMNSSRLWMK